MSSIATSQVFIRDLVLPCRIGALASEQDVAQPVRFSVRIDLTPGTVPRRLEDTLCYVSVADYIRSLGGTHIPLAEDYADRIARYCLDFPVCHKVSVCVEKLAIMPEAGSVGASVTLQRQ